MTAESKTGCFLNFPKKTLSGPALPRREGFCCPHDAYGQVEK